MNSQIESLVSALKHGEMGMKDLLSQIENLNVSQISSPGMILPINDDSRRSRENMSQEDNSRRMFLSEDD